MMTRLPGISLLAVLFFGGHASVAAEEGRVFPDTWQTPDSEPLIKLGEYRYVYRFFFKLYDAGLFIAEGADAQSVLDRSAAFHLEFRYLREIEKSIILKSADKMLEKNLSEAERSSIADQVEQLNEAYRTVRKGDKSSLTYLPDQGTTFRINGVPQLTIEGQAFAELYFRIWLGDAPISSEMKQVLLGGE